MTYRDQVSDTIRRQRVAERRRRRMGQALLGVACGGVALIYLTPLGGWLISLDEKEQAYLIGAYLACAVVASIGLFMCGILPHGNRGDRF